MVNRKDDIVKRKSFDIQEAVILLDVYLYEKNNHLKRTVTSRIASERLRSLAVRRGMNFSDSFRSPMGLQNRLRSIGGLYEDKESISAPGTEVFREAVTLYKNDRQRYQQMLNDTGGALPRRREEKPARAKSKFKIVRTKYVRTTKDQMLKDKYSSGFNDVYYALKSLSKKNITGVTGTDIFIALRRRIMRKEVLDMLNGASWSKAVTAGHYVFYDKEQEERKERAMDEAIKKAESDFFAWLPSAISPYTLESVKSSYKAVNSMLIQKKILTQPLIMTTQLGQIENAMRQVKHVFGNKGLRNNAIKLLMAYLAYLRENKNTQPMQLEELKVDVQEKWIYFDFLNATSFERTYPVCCNVNGRAIEGRSWSNILVAIVEIEISNENPALKILYKKPLYSDKSDMPFLMKRKIEGLLCSELSNGYWINVNWSIPHLMEIIRGFCLHCGYNKKQVILYGAPNASISDKHEHISQKKSAGRKIDMVKAEAILRDAGLQGTTVQEMIDAIQPEAAFWPVKNALDKNLNVIAMPNNRYVHVDSFVDLEEAGENLGKILSTHFGQFGGYSNNQLLFGAASQELSMFLNDNDCENIDAVYAIARYMFEKKAITGKSYKFYPPHIFEVEPDYPMNLRGLMINLARSNDGILYTIEAKNYLQKTMLTYSGIGKLLQIGTSNTFLMYDDDRYLLSEVLEIDDAWCLQMHDRVDDLFRKANVAYVIPRDIRMEWLSTLPVLPQGLQWTHLLLQEVLDKYPTIGFKSISADLNQPYHTLAAAFIPIDSPLQTFPDVVTLFMQERFTLPMRMSGEKLRLELRDAGMLEACEMIYALPKALDDYRFAWTDENKTVYIRGNK